MAKSELEEVLGMQTMLGPVDSMMRNLKLEMGPCRDSFEAAQKVGFPTVAQTRRWEDTFGAIATKLAEHNRLIESCGLGAFDKLTSSQREVMRQSKMVADLAGGSALQSLVHQHEKTFGAGSRVTKMMETLGAFPTSAMQTMARLQDAMSSPATASDYQPPRAPLQIQVTRLPPAATAAQVEELRVQSAQDRTMLLNYLATLQAKVTRLEAEVRALKKDKGEPDGGGNPPLPSGPLN
jgi:hypothetical protein